MIMCNPAAKTTATYLFFKQSLADKQWPPSFYGLLYSSISKVPTFQPFSGLYFSAGASSGEAAND